jgi:hypothetical protein
VSAAAPLLAFMRAAVPMWVGTIFVAAGTVAAVAAFEDWQAERRFERDAVAAEGHVVETSFEPAGRDGNSRTRYLVTYRFAGADGVATEQTEEIAVEDWERLHDGGTVAVRFLPGDPASARTRGADPEWVGPLIVGALTMFALIGAVIALPYWRRLVVLARLQRSGVEAQATVVEVAPSGTTINRVPQWQIRYEYRDSSGVARRGTSDLLSPVEAAAWQVGDRGAVRFARERPDDSAWLGRAGS